MKRENDAAAKIRPGLAARIFASVVSVLGLIVLGLGLWFYSRLHASLPQLDGTSRAAGVKATVTIERDALGVPTIRADTRIDAARALGFLHGQERFFQMDLLRRRAAGELAELFGAAAVPIDRNTRRNGFRTLAQKVVAAMGPGERNLIEAYAAGVNGGLAALGSKPFEYQVLRATPQAWRPEDSALVVYAMALTLGDSVGRYEHSLDTLRNIYGVKALAFFSPLVAPEDAALDDSTAALPPIPGPEVIDLRKKPAVAADNRRNAGTLLRQGFEGQAFPYPTGDDGAGAERASVSSEFFPGSNSMAVAGSHTADGAAVLANDMHLDLAVPNIWYRASLVYGLHRITGFTLPGSPAVVAGSNGHVAWGFTASQVDAGDLVPITPVPSTDLYRVPRPPSGDDLRKRESRREVIQVKGSSPIEVFYDWTIWGPIVGNDSDGRPLAYRWMEHDPAATNFGLMGLDLATTVDEAVAVAHRAGIPALNFLAADSAGHIAWTIAGRLPKRVGYDGRLPVAWTYGDRRWDGFLAADDVPTVKDPVGAILWTANNRIVGGRALALLGDGGYVRPARAAQLRDDLAALEQSHPAAVKPADLLAIQLDDRAVFLERWQKLLLKTLTPEVVARKSSRAELRGLVEKWEGRANVDSVGYTLVRAFRRAVARQVLLPIFAPCQSADPGFDWNRLNYEDAVWTLVQAQPLHLLNPRFGNWTELLVAAADDAVTEAENGGQPLSAAAWGPRNALQMRHPFSRVLPAWATNWLNMPVEPLPGDTDMPRVQAPAFGASERFAVAPGHEEDGICEMPGGQSGHPLSPYYRAGHEAWVHGDPTPFLPGKPQHTLVLQPAQ